MPKDALPNAPVERTPGPATDMSADYARTAGPQTLVATVTAVAVTACIIGTADTMLAALAWGLLGMIDVSLVWIGRTEFVLLALSAVPAGLLFRQVLAAERQLRAEGMPDEA